MYIGHRGIGAVRYKTCPILMAKDEFASHTTDWSEIQSERKPLL